MIRAFWKKSLLTLLILSVVFVGTAEAALSGGQINVGAGFVAAGNGTLCNVDTPPVLSVGGTEQPAVWVNFRYNGATWRLPLTNGVTDACIQMPVIPSGVVEYRFEAGAAFEPHNSTNAVEFLPTAGSYYSYNTKATLSEALEPSFQTWYTRCVSQSAAGDQGKTLTLDDNWRIMTARMNSNRILILDGSETTTGAGNFLATRNKMKVGTIWLWAYNAGDSDATLVIDRAGIPGFSGSTLTTVRELTIPGSSGWMLIRVDVNDETGNNYYRIRRPKGPGHGSSAIYLQKLVVSPIAADVRIHKEMVEHDPGYPSRNDPITFKIQVQNVYTTSPAENISPKLMWRLNIGLTKGAWNTSPMDPIGDDFYQVQLPPQGAGEFEYYYRVDFTGYAYTCDVQPSGTSSLENLRTYSQWLDSNNQIREMKYPAYYPDFENSHLYDISQNPPRNINTNVPLDIESNYFDYLRFTVRRFRSKHNELNLTVQDYSGDGLNINPFYPLEQVGDYTWQTVIHTTNAVATGLNVDVGFAVVGTDRYEAGVPAYEALPHTWLAVNQDETAWNPPMSGNLNDNPETGTPRLRVQMDYDGFIMFRFCSTNGTYEIRRAAWQDFNSWQAVNNEFMRSFGLFETTVFESNLNDFSPSIPESAGFLPFEAETNKVSNFDPLLSNRYMNGLKVDKVRVIEERGRMDPTDLADVTRNRALLISADPKQLGSIETTRVTATDGRDTLKMRVRASVNDENRAYYRLGDTLENYQFIAQAHTVSMAESEASLSVYAYYQDEMNYLEGRLVQLSTLVKDRQQSTDQMRLELIQMKDGEKTELETTTVSGRLTQEQWILVLDVRTVNASQGTGTAQFILKNASGSNVKTTNAKAFTVDTAVFLMGGTVAVNARDAQTTFTVSMTTSAGAPMNAIQNSTQNQWYLGGRLNATSPSRWSFVPGPAQLARVIPQVGYRVNVYRDHVGNNNFIAPVPTESKDWDPDWDELGENDQPRSVNSLAWTDVEVPMQLWDDVFIQIKPTGSDGALVIDDLEVDEWRGKTLYDEGLDPGDAREELPWKATYAVRTRENGSVMYELNRTRANPAENQMIVSPLLEDGIGDFLCNFRVARGNVQFSVQTLLPNGAVDRTLVTTNAVVNENFERLYVSALTNITGRLRLLVDPVASSPDGLLYVDNLKATDYPDPGDTSWKAYNVLISTYDWMPEIKFDGAGNTEFRSATLNDSTNRDTPLEAPLDEDQPFIQSPRIETGIGEVSFWYRSYSDAQRPGKVYLKAAKEEADFANNPQEVVTLGVIDLNPDAPTYLEQVDAVAGITNVTENVWTRFTVEFYKAEYKVLRFYGDTESSSRVMIDNIIVTEPVRSSIDIESVKLVPDVPLYTDDVGVEVNLANPRMNPQNIRVDFLYTLGTNVWGRQNWETHATVVPLVQDPEDAYRFTGENVVPKLPIDTVVQYTVRVTYTGTFPQDVYYGEEFENPSWYEPVNLNTQFGAQLKTPYYYVFSVGTNVVFINEILPYSGTTRKYNLGSQYVELIGVENGNIANWRLEHLDVDASTQGTKDVVKWTNIMKPRATFTARRRANAPQDVASKGWGFYVLGVGDVRSENPAFDVMYPDQLYVDQELFPASFFTPDFEDFATSEEIGMGMPGALCLRRSMGAYVQRLTWGSGGDTQALVDRGYTYIGNRGTGSSTRSRVFQWDWNEDEANPKLEWYLASQSSYSPGYYNEAQEEYIWAVTPEEPMEPEEPTEMAEIAAPRITSIVMGEHAVTLEFEVSTTNEVALDSTSGYTWYLETSEDVGFTNPLAVEISEDIVAPADGSPTTYSLDVEFTDPISPNLFYRIKAVHP